MCIGQIEASTSPPGTPGHLTFLKIIVQIAPYPCQNAVQMPHTSVHWGFSKIISCEYGWLFLLISAVIIVHMLISEDFNWSIQVIKGPHPGDISQAHK